MSVPWAKLKNSMESVGSIFTQGDEKRKKESCTRAGRLLLPTSDLSTVSFLLLKNIKELITQDLDGSESDRPALTTHRHAIAFQRNLSDVLCRATPLPCRAVAREIKCQRTAFYSTVSPSLLGVNANGILRVKIQLPLQEPFTWTPQNSQHMCGRRCYPASEDEVTALVRRCHS